jgi:hypothetical protein
LFFRLPFQDLPDVPVRGPEAVLEGGQANRRNRPNRPDPAPEIARKSEKKFILFKQQIHQNY